MAVLQRKGKSGSRQSYETDINSGYRGLGWLASSQPPPISLASLLLGPQSLFNKKAYLFPLSGE